LIGAKWSEVDFENRCWTMPVSKMKMGATHAVPLSNWVVAILRQLHEITGGDPSPYIVSVARAGQPLSNMGMQMAMRR